MPDAAPRGPRADRRAVLAGRPRFASLSPAEQALSRAITAAPLSWSWIEGPADPETLKQWEARLRRLAVRGEEALAWLAGLLSAGHAPETSAALEAAGLIEPWISPLGRAATLSPAGAFDLGVELVEFGDDADPETRWQPRGLPPLPIRLRRRVGPLDQDRLARLVDPRGGPEDELLRRRLDLVIDEWTGRPLRLFQGPDGRDAGVAVARDRRTRPAGGRAKAKDKAIDPRTAAPEPGPGPFAVPDALRPREAEPCPSTSSDP